MQARRVHIPMIRIELSIFRLQRNNKETRYIFCIRSVWPKPLTGENRGSIPVLMINVHASIRGYMHLAAATLAR